jgi:hypothetical protein
MKVFDSSLANGTLAVKSGSWWQTPGAMKVRTPGPARRARNRIRRAPTQVTDERAAGVLAAGGGGTACARNRIW